ncbi:MAG: UDP-N-acetylglucosamine--N-acetylmuramyl-(pentapeptide) pyrophosphoryl-undecaprenol N-acetylglucosamine transferase [Candidatus Yanofskybacteria bacterium]|nr:UDP-N-acetylglucosamine--N-acetylmuramyl-(pentapeptide) pyrophosphoryl-undecaprenol N-acetylglucosamine transferase [Candidatus Yanofskybacteria bacterium]
MTKRVLLVGGGSGGHVYPLVAVAQALQKEAAAKNIKLDLLLMGEGGITERAAKEHGFKFKRVIAGKFPRYIDPLILWHLIKMPLSFFQALWQLFWYMPNIIFSKGGYDSVMPALVGKLYFIPVFVHESDSVPGMANQLIGKIAAVVFLAFKSAAKYFTAAKTVVVGNPVREDLFGITHEAGLQQFQLSGDKKVILVMGGSQGAQQINAIILDSLVQLTEKYQVIHQCGPSQLDRVSKEVEKLTTEGGGKYVELIEKNYHLFPYLDSTQYPAALAAADVVVSRAGAGSLFEIAAVGKPAVIIPLANAANNHQLLNAAEFSRVTGAAVVEGTNMTTNILMNQIDRLLEPGNYATISQSMKSFATPGAATTIAQALLTALQ